MRRNSQRVQSANLDHQEKRSLSLSGLERAVKHEHNKVLAFKNSSRCAWRLRDDSRRALIYEFSEDDQNISKMGFLHPSEAVMLALFNGRRTVGEIEKEMAYLFEVNAANACQAVSSALSRWPTTFEVATDGNCQVYDPMKFIVPVQQIDLTNRRLYRPLSLVLYATDDCMRDCIYCNVQKRKTRDVQPLSRQRWDELAEEAASIGIGSVILGGGDPFMNNDIFEIVHSFYRRNLRALVPTKSYVSPTAAKRLSDIGMQRMQVSIDAPNASIADFMTNSRGYFRQAVGTIRNLIRGGIRVRTNSVITPYNIRQAPELILMLAAMGVDIIRLTGCGASLFVQNNNPLLLDRADALWLESEVARIREDSNMQVDVSFSFSVDASFLSKRKRNNRFRQRAQCTAGRWGLIIHSDGKVVLCDQLPMTDFFVVGDVSHESIMDVWRSPRIGSLTSPPQEEFEGTVCYQCPYFHDCHQDRGRCFRDAFRAFGGFYAPTPDCPRAPRGRRLS